MASRAAATISWEKRAMRRAALRSMKSAGTNSGISPANLQGNSVVSKNVM